MLLDACASGARPDTEALAQSLEGQDRRLLFEIAFEGHRAAEWAEAESCLDVLRLRKAEEELAAVQRQLEAQLGGGSTGTDEVGRLCENPTKAAASPNSANPQPPPTSISSALAKCSVKLAGRI